MTVIVGFLLEPCGNFIGIQEALEFRIRLAEARWNLVTLEYDVV